MTTEGLTLITPTAVSAVSVGTATIEPSGLVTFDNARQLRVEGVFSSSYDDYFVVYGGSLKGTGTAWYHTSGVRLMNGSTPDSTSIYGYSRTESPSSNAGNVVNTGTTDRFVNLRTGGPTDTAFRAFSVSLYLFSPFDGTRPTVGISMGGNWSGTYYYGYESSLSTTNSGSYDGLEIDLWASSVDIRGTGTIAVYGINR